MSPAAACASLSGLAFGPCFLVSVPLALRWVTLIVSERLFWSLSQFSESQKTLPWWRCRAVKQALRPGATKLLMLESPTNPRMQVCDLRALTRAAHEAGALVCVDNSIMAFLYQRPLDLGADISMTSATKFVGGHSDVTAGLLSVRDAQLGQRIYFHQVKRVFTVASKCIGADTGHAREQHKSRVRLAVYA